MWNMCFVQKLPYKKVKMLWVAGTVLVALSPIISCAAEKRPWGEVKSWGYQLQDIKLEELATSPFDLLVIDYSRDGSDFQRFSKEEIHTLKYAKNKRRLVLAYLSIGEAESYRYYWQESWKRKRPHWLERENPDWEGNYKVRYWDLEWQRILFTFLDKIISVGFDGIYVDVIDAYEYFEERGRRSAAKEMKQLVKKIAHYAREIWGDRDFGIFPQNGEELLLDSEYVSVITGIGKEDTYFGYDDENQPSPTEVTSRIERFLKIAKKAGKLVLNVDYTTDPEKIAQAYTQASSRGYVEYCATRELEQLIPQPWFPKVMQ